MATKRLLKLKEGMNREKLDVLLIPTSDYHSSEYVSEYFQARKYFSGFTGSAGTLVVCAKETALFTDGRYFIQAEKELQGSDIRLMKMGEPGVPKLSAYVEEMLPEGGTLGFDGRLITAEDGQRFYQIAKKKGAAMRCEKDFAGEAWENRPSLAFSKAYILEDCYAGESRDRKLARLRQEMEQRQADIHYLTTLDDIAWLLNLRADDVESCPVLLAYMAVTMTEAILFAGEGALSPEIQQILNKSGVTVEPYDSFYSYVEKQGKKRVLVSTKRINYRLLSLLQTSDAPIIDQANPTTRMKAVKNVTEQVNIRKAHLMDAIAVTRFMYWLKSNIGKLPMDEVSVSDYLTALRAENPSFIEPSFATISAYVENGAIIHYSAKRGACKKLAPAGMLMVDSGGHYLEGTTDITRTFILGEITDEMRAHFTLVCRAVMRLKSLKFRKGCKGANLDLAARSVFWEQGLDYRHGTGHGVGYLLSVHEGPNSFRYQLTDGVDLDWEFEEGMITTDEPGIYIEGSHGIRTENELLCVKAEETAYGQFLQFEDLTYVPIDLDGIDSKAMEPKEKEALNAYHRAVYEKLKPYFEGEELAFLKHATRAV